MQIGDEPKDVAKFVSQFRNDGGEIAEWRADATLEEFVARCADLPFVRQGFSDDHAKVSVYRESTVVSRSLHLEELAGVRYPSWHVPAIHARLLISWSQSVSRDSVGRLNAGFGQEFVGPWPPSELWLVGSFAAFSDGTLSAERFVAANKNRHEGQDPPRSLEEEGFEVTSDPEPPKKQTAKRTGAVEFLGTASSTSKPAESKSTYPIKLHLKLSGKPAEATVVEKTKVKKPAPKVKKVALKKGKKKKSWMISSDSEVEDETANVGARE